jgi:FlaA1/EpsC-like NDP-sugar epimerase
MAKGGEVFVLDMGAPVRILDLARQMIELSGLRVKDGASPDGDIEIKVVGLRPGEKLYEELLIGNRPEATNHPRILKANEETIPLPVLKKDLDRLSDAIAANDHGAVRAIIRAIVPDFQPQSELVDWVYLEARPDAA